MVEIPDLSQLNLSDLTNQIFNDLLVKLKPVLYIILILLVIYIIYKLTKFILAWRKERREKLTYFNTEKILEILTRIESKLDKILVKKEEKPEKKAKEEKKKKSK